MNCIGTNPNVDTFICQNGGWVPKNHELAAQHAPVISPSSLDWQPPTADEYEDVKVYPGTNTDITAPVMVRTANSANWFVDGNEYRHPYSYVVRVDGVALRNLEGRWHWCHRLVIIETAGDPPVGYVLYARIFAPRSNWTEVTR